MQFIELFPDKNEPWKKMIELAQLVRAEKENNFGAAYYSKKLHSVSKGANGTSILNKTVTTDRSARRIKKKLLEFISLDYNLTAEEKDVDYIGIQLQKKSIEFRVLSRMQKSHRSEHDLLDDIIKQAKNYECYSILVAHLQMKKQYWGKLGQENYDALCLEIEHYKKREEAAETTMDCLYRLQIFEEYNKNANPLSLIKEKIPVLKKIVADYTSPLALYVLKLFEQEEQALLKNYEKATAICFEIVKIIETNKTIKTQCRMGIAQAQLSQTLIYSNRFSESLKHVRKSLEYYSYGSFNYICSKGCEFYGLFYNQEYLKAEECIRFMLTHSPREQVGEFRYAQYRFFLANVLFRQKNFAEVIQLLNDQFEISHDKAGWAIGLRLLRIMTTIEMENHDEAGKQIEQLRKFITFTERNQTEVTLRNKTIMKFLSLADKEGFMFSQLNNASYKHLSELITGNNGNAWEYFSPELIPFHEWAEGKMKIKNLKK